MEHLRSKIGTNYRVGPAPTTKWMTYLQVVPWVQQVRFYGMYTVNINHILKDFCNPVNGKRRIHLKFDDEI